MKERQALAEELSFVICFELQSLPRVFGPKPIVQFV
jgi:hypothetical protein